MGPGRIWLAVLFLGIGLTVLGCKWWVVHEYGSEVPLGDQWYAEAIDYSRFEQGQLRLADMFRLHNEHRIVTTRIWHLAWYVINDRIWSPRLQMAANAVVAALTLLLLLRATLDARHPKLILPVALVATIIGVIPLAWGNLTSSFQIQFHWAILFQTLAMLIWLGQRALSWRWWAGFLPYLLAILSMATGSLIALPVACVLALRCWKQPDRSSGIAAAVLFALGIGLGLLASLLASDTHGAQTASSVATFLSVTFMGLSAPFMGLAWPVWALWVPFAVHLIRQLLGRNKPVDALDERLIALGLWVIALCASVGYARAGQGLSPANRYLEYLIIGLLVNVACLVRLIAPAIVGLARPRFNKPAWLLAAWLALVLVGYHQSSTFVNPVNKAAEGWRVAPQQWFERVSTMGNHLHQYITTGDVSHIVNPGMIPILGPTQSQKEKADDLSLRRVLPPHLLAAKLPVDVIAQGKALWPGSSPQKPLFNHNRFGLLSQPGSPESGRLRLTYRTTPDRRWFVIQPKLFYIGGQDIGLYCHSNGKTRTLIAPGPHNRYIDGPMYFKVDADQFELELIDHEGSKGGTFSITSPVPVGRASWMAETLMGHYPVIIVMGVMTCLACGWWYTALPVRSDSP